MAYKAGRNEPCPCGSGIKFKRCHGKLAETPAGPQLAPAEAVASAIEKFGKGNLPQAELLCREFLARVPDDPFALTVLGDIAARVGAQREARRYYSQALRRAPDATAARTGYERAGTALGQAASNTPRDAAREARFLLIKAWGYGFWADVDHVIGQLLLAEMTGRVPVVYWGKNSLFRSPEEGNAFELYFEPVSGASIADLADPALTYYPPKWRCDNLLEEDLAKWSGPHSRVAGLYLLHRAEDVAVSDFHSSVIDLMPWTEKGSAYFNASREDIYRRLFAKHVRLRPHLQQRIDAFWQEHMQGRKWLGVHVRGSDKAGEAPDLERVNREYFSHVDRLLGADPALSLFLLTDSEVFLSEYRRRYGARVLCTQCIRVSGSVGVHNAGHPGVQVAEEVIVDTYLAARCDYFLGNGTSNVSLAVEHLKPWPQGRFALFGGDYRYRRNAVLHNW